MRPVLGSMPTSFLAIVLLSIARPGEGYTVVKKLIRLWRGEIRRVGPELDDRSGTTLKL